jgi:cation-transporting ATPase E
MTGDGVNDVLALKLADLGIAMGSGAAATKAVANLILLDGKFSSLPGVVAEGRRVIANIERVSRLFLTKTTWAMTLAIVFGAMLWTFPFLPRQISAIDGFTIGVPSFVLAILPNKRRYLPGFLKRSLMFCVPAGVLIAGFVVWLDILTRQTGNWNTAESQTAVAILLSVTGLWVLTALARPLRGWTLGVVIAMFGLCALEFTVPIVKDFFGFATLAFDQLLVPIGLGVLACMLIEVVQNIVSRMNKN